MKNTILLSLLALLMIVSACSETKSIAQDGEDTGRQEMQKADEATKDAVAEAERAKDNLQKETESVKDRVRESLSFRSQAPEAGPARSIEIGDYETFTLDNGLKVIVVENHKIPKVSWQLSVDNDPVLEGHKAGYVSIAGQMLDQGTTTRTKAEIDEAVDFMGAFFNTGSSGMFARTLTKYKEDMLDIMSDVLYNPAFPEEEFEKIRKQTLSSIAQGKENPDAISGNVTSVLRYGKDHPYGEISTEATVNNITLQDCKDYYNSHFKPNKSYLVVVGDITPEEAKRLSQKYFGQWKASEVPRKKYDFPRTPDGPMVAFVPRDGAVQSVIKVTNVIDLKPDSEDLLAANVMNSILGGGVFSGRLMMNLREDKGYTYGARSQIRRDDVVGYFNAGASVRTEVTDSAVVEFMSELNRMRSEPVAEEELSLVKNVMSGSFARSLEQPQTVANFALNTVKYDLPEDHYASYLQRLEAVTIEDVMAAAKKYIRPEHTIISVVGNPKVADKLKAMDKNNIVHFYDAFGDPMRNVQKEMPEGVTAESILEDYFSARGGKEKLSGVRGIHEVYKTEAMGMVLKNTVKAQRPNKYFMQLGSDMMTMQTMVYDGEKGKISSMQDPEGAELDDEMLRAAKEEATIFPELFRKKLGMTAKLIGVENVNGQPAYKVEYMDAVGETLHFDFFDQQTSLRVKQVSIGEMGQTVTVFKDYKEVEGILFPGIKEVNIPGVPTPLVFEMETLELNPEHEANTFEVR